MEEFLSPLFQFRKIDNYLFQTLINQTLWFSSPRVFNDPFDCQLPVQTDNSLEEITKYLLKLNEIRKYYSNKKDIIKRANELYSDKEQLKSFLHNKFFNERRFSCFVDDENLVYRNTSMWGNYADKSKGVCLKFQFEFDIEKSFEFENGIKISPLPVKYTQSIPRFNYIRMMLGIKQDINSVNQYFLGTKSEDWQKESEVRLIIENSSGKIFDSEYVGVRFNPFCLKEIIFGCNSFGEDKNVITKIIDCIPEYSHVKIIRLNKSEKFFGFDIL
jgi:hypothetical protein